jgi:hypothetical protein
MGLRHFMQEQTRDTNAGSLSQRLRNARFEQFQGLLQGFDRPVRILDIGGTSAYWDARGLADSDTAEITTVNPIAEPKRFPNITPIAGDGCNLADLEDGSFDVVFSNSTIEHVYTRHAQEDMAREIRRLAPTYYVQTPNFWFPVEPHYLAPAWHWTPRGLRVAVVKRTRVGHYGPYPDPAEAWSKIEEIRMLSARQLRELFPDGELHPERVGPAVKSWTVIRRTATS